MAIEGSLADVGLADICQLLTLGRKTGCLAMTDRSNFGYIYLEQGTVIHATVLDRPDRLGDVLVRNGAITGEDLTAAIEEQTRQQGKRLGELLVELGSLTEEELNRWISLQTEEAVYHLFTWDTGSFHFNPDEMPDEEVLRVALSADALLMEGARRVDEWSLIEKKITSMDLIFSLERDPSEAEGVELNPAQEKIIPLLDGERTVNDLVTESGLVEFETAKALYELAQAGFVREVGERTAAGQKPDLGEVQKHVNLGLAFYRAGMLEDAEREFIGAMEGDASESTARFHLGVIALKTGKTEEALEHFGSVSEEKRNGYGVLRNRALVLERLGRFDEALEVLREAGTRQPDDPDLILARAVTELKSGDASSANATFGKYRMDLTGDTPPPMYYAFAVLAAAISGKMEEAVSLGREGLEEHPGDPSILVNTGVVLDRKGEHEAAEAYFLRAVQSGSAPPPQAHKNLGDQAFRRRDIMGAQAHFERAVKLDPNLGEDVYLKLGQIAYDAADKDLALLLWRKASDINPDDERVRENLDMLSAAP